MNKLTDPERFREWADQPLTREYLRFLADSRAALVEAWGRGHSMTEQQQGQAVLLGRLSALECEDVKAVYLEDDDGE
jgi:hypothetical protein